MLTPAPKIDALLDTLLAEVCAILGSRLVGMYLDGSLLVPMGARARGRLRRATHDPGARSTARSLPVHRAWGYRCYAVLTMCRMLYTLHHGAIVSKPGGGRSPPPG